MIVYPSTKTITLGAKNYTVQIRKYFTEGLLPRFEVVCLCFRPPETNGTQAMKLSVKLVFVVTSSAILRREDFASFCLFRGEMNKISSRFH